MQEKTSVLSLFVFSGRLTVEKSDFLTKK